MPPSHPPSLPSPPSTDNDATTTSSKAPSKRGKISKPGPRGAKRAAHVSGTRSPELDGRHKRVWKACERCRMKKTKCDGESPCKRCKDDGLVCTAGSRKKAEFKQLPRGYAEVLENTQYALIATVHKLYAMVLASEPWTLPPPALNARGQPVIHDIASKLGCIRQDPSSPSNGAIEFPADAEEFAALQRRLESEELLSSGSVSAAMGVLSAAPESPFGDSSFCEEFGDGFDDETAAFGDVNGAYGDVDPFEEGFPMEGLMEAQQLLQQQRLFDEFLPSETSPPPQSTTTVPVPVPTAAQGGQIRLPKGMQLASQQQQQSQAQQQQQQQQQAVMRMRAQQIAMQQQQQQQQHLGLDFRDPQQQPWNMAAATAVAGGMGVYGSIGDGTIRPNLLECGFGAGGAY